MQQFSSQQKRRTYDTVKQIQALKRPAVGQVEYYDALAARLDPPAPGLAVRVSRSGTKSFCLNYRFHDRAGNTTVARRDTIGRFSEDHDPHQVVPDWHPRCPLTLKEARAVAAHILNLAGAGIDPHGAQQKVEAVLEQARANTYASIVDSYWKIYQVQKKNNRSADETRARLLRVNPTWHDVPVSKITQSDISTALEAVMDKGQIYEANRRYSALRHFFDWTKKRKLIAENPAADIDLPSDGEEKRKRFWSDAEVAAIWTTAEGLGAKYAAWLRVMILTGARPNEVAKMQIEDLDLQSGVWIIPPERHKTGKKTKAPISFELSGLAVRILKGLLKSDPPPMGNPYIFYGNGTRNGEPNHITLNTRLRNRIRRLSGVSDYYDYAARHTFATGLQDTVKAPPHIISLCTNHRRRSTTDGYMHGNYSDGMRDACEKWAQHIERLVYPDRVVGLHG